MNAPIKIEQIVADAVAKADQSPDPALIERPDMRVLSQHRRPPPSLPLDVFGPVWMRFIKEAAKAAAAPADYVAAALLAAVSALIGNARWAQSWPGWSEPPHLWCCAVGDSGGGKSPGSDAVLGQVLPELESRAEAGFPDRLRQWQAQAEAHQAAIEKWKEEVRTAEKKGTTPPLPPATEPPPEPQMPRLRINDVTIERVATLLASAAPKGVLVCRDEIAGWLLGMNQYNDAGRAFWVESYGGRPYRVERQKYSIPIDVPRLAVSVFGGTQPDKLAEMMRAADDGLLARFCWFWPEPVPFDLSQSAPGIKAAIEALDALRRLELVPGAGDEPRRPLLVSLEPAAIEMMRKFGRKMQERQKEAGGLMCSALGKARGIALRLALVLEYLWWSARDGASGPPTTISVWAFTAATRLVEDYLMPMAERVFGDAAARPEDRNAATLARWIMREKPAEVHVRTLQRDVRLPGLGTAEAIHAACRALMDSGWLLMPEAQSGVGRPRRAYGVNPKVWEAEG